MSNAPSKVQWLQLPFTGGLDEKTAPEYTDPSQRNSGVNNGVFTHVGAISKRLGLEASGYVDPSWARLTATRAFVPLDGGGVIAIGDSDVAANRAMVLHPDVAHGTAGDRSFTDVGPVPYVRAARTPIASLPNALGPRLCDFGEFRMIVSDTSTADSYTYSVYDRTTGAVVIDLTTTACTAGSGIVQVMLSPQETKVFIVIYHPGTTYTNWVRVFDIATMTMGAEVNIIGAYGSPDACAFVGDSVHNGFLLTGTTPGGTTVVRLWYVDDAGSVVATLNVYTGSDPIIQPAVIQGEYGASGDVWLAWVRTNGGVYYQEMCHVVGDGTFTVAVSATIAATAYYVRAEAVTTISPGVGWLLTTRYANTSGWVSNALYGSQTRVSAALAGLSAAPWPYGFTPCGRPIVTPSGDVVVPAILALYRTANNYASAAHRTQQETLYLVGCTVEKTRVIATVAPRQVDQTSRGYLTILGASGLPYMSTGDVWTGHVAVALGLRPIELTATQNTTGPQFQVDFDFASSLLYQSGEIGDGAHVSSAVPMACDGTMLCEDSFFYYPEFAWVTQSAYGADPGAGDYSFAVLYKYIAADGSVTRGAPAFIAPTTLAAGNDFTVLFPRLSQSWRTETARQVTAEVYRTVKSGIIYYLLGEVDVSPVSFPSTDAQLYTSLPPSGVSDDKLQVASLLYTTGGVLDHVNPPASRCQTVHKNRLWMVDETGTTIWFSTAYTPGESVGFNEVLTFGLYEGGPITALASLDDKLVIFKKDAIYIVFGDPPPLTGVGSSLTEPQRVASDVGAVDWRSVVLTPRGLMFQAANGIHTLGRDLQVVFSGKTVQDTLGSQTVTAAVLVTAQTHVRFHLQGSTSVLVYDYLLDQWATFGYDSGGGSIGAVAGGRYLVADPLSTCVSRERLASDAHAYYDCAQGTGDTPVWVPLGVTTPAVKVNGIQGYQRVRRAQVFDSSTASHGVHIDVIADPFTASGDPSHAQVAEWSAMALTSSPRGAQLEMHIAGALNKCASMAFTLYDVPPPVDAITGKLPGNGQGAVFTSLAVEIDTIGQRYRRAPVTSKR